MKKEEEEEDGGPIKVFNKWESPAIRNGIEDGVKQYILEEKKFTESFALMNGRLGLSFVACLVALVALGYDWYFPFPLSKAVLIACVVVYFCLAGALSYYMYYVEAGSFLEALEEDAAGLDPPTTWRFSSKIGKYDHYYTLTVEGYFKNPDAKYVESIEKSVGEYFYENGELVYDTLEEDLKTLMELRIRRARAGDQGGSTN